MDKGWSAFACVIALIAGFMAAVIAGHAVNVDRLESGYWQEGKQVYRITPLPRQSGDSH